MDQHVKFETRAGKRYIASRSPNRFVRTQQDFLDLLAWGTENETSLFLLNNADLVPEFYDLTTGLVGEILQKLSNYRAWLIIVGSFEMVVSKRFRELMIESNNGSQIRFARSRDEAISWLVG